MHVRTIAARLAVVTTTIAMFAFAPGSPAHAAPPHNITIDDVSITEGTSGSTNLDFTISVSGPAVAGVTVDYTTADATATAGSDYVSTTGTAALANGGCRCATVSIPVEGETAIENDEIFVVTLSDAVGGTITDGQGVGTITNDDLPNASVNDPVVAENLGTLTFTVSLDATAPFDSIVGYTTGPDTATADADYTTTSGTLTVAAGATSGSVDVPVLDDSTYEGNEALTLDITAVSGVVVADTQGHGTITEDDAAPSITVDDPTVAEDGATMTFTISLDATAAVDVAIDYATSDGTATAGADYTGTSGTATITAGNTTTAVDVSVLDDGTYEGDEMLALDLSGEVNGALSDTQGHGTITEDDAAPGVSVADASVTEGTAGTKNLSFIVTLSNPSAFDLTVDVTTADGTAVAPDDYTAVSSDTVLLPAGVETSSAEISILGDTAFEVDETFTITLGNLVGTGTIDTPAATGTITNDDTQASRVTLKATETRAKIGAKGILEPATAGNTVTATLARYRNGHWVTVATKTVTVRKLSDRDADGSADARYGASFARPTHGRYRFTAVFGGDPDTKSSSKKVTFKL